ncbi:M20/M25/M40 family metallo-hydrolase [Nocardia terpenica]|uniref:M20/M25/M40 family metallo-hydrolase n=1 Tax=Nocardia terpenica TaxID=455432 RepID=UPI002FE2B9A5
MRFGPRISGVVAFAVLLIVAVATAWAQQPHGHRPASAPADTFSAERALRTVTAIAARPHPAGTAEHDRVRDHLVGELRNLGLDTEIQSGVGRWPEAFHRDVMAMGRVDNIVARIPGSAPTGTVFLTAHYDSVPSGPGANDDGVGVATILETVRALRAAQATLRNSVVVLLTDGEENGTLGAEAYVAAHRDELRGGVVVNLEARGAGGAPVLWRTTRPDGRLIDAVAAGAPYPNTDSLSTALAGDQTSSNTDYAAFQPGGLRVLDWAYAQRSAYYHNPFDDPAHVDPATVQRMGENTLALTREFGGRDLTAADEPNRAYLSLPFGPLLMIPVWAVIALAVLALLAVAWVIVQVRRSGEASVRGVVGAAATAFAAVPIAMAAVYGLWAAVLAVRPDYRPLFGDPYRPGCYYAAVVVLAVAVLIAGFLLSRRWFGATAAHVGLLASATVVSAAAAALAPTAAVVFVLPTYLAALGVAATFVVPRAWRLPVLTLSLIPAAVQVGGTVWTALAAGIVGAPFLAAPALALLGGLLLLPLAQAWPRRRVALIPATAVLLTVAATAAGLAVDRFDDRHPLMSQLVYALDADRHEARWMSRTAPNRWTGGFLDTHPPTGQFAELLPQAVASRPAPAQALPAPIVDIVSDSTESGQRTVRLHVRSPRGATALELRYDTEVRSLRVAGREFTPVPRRGVLFYAPPAEGIDIDLTAPAGPLPLTVLDRTYLPDSKLAALGTVPPDIFFRQDSEAIVFGRVPGV